MTQVTTGVRLNLEVQDGGAVQKVKTLDSALQDLDRSIDLLSRDLIDSEVDRFERDLDEAAKAADRLDRETRAAGGGGVELLRRGAAAAALALAGMATAFALARQNSVAFHQNVAITADVTGASAREIEGLARVAEEYGLDIDRVSDAYRDFAERIGEARLEPDGSIAEAFELANFNINAADASLLGFLNRVSQLDDRAREAFIIRTVLTGDSEEFLTLVRDGATSRVDVALSLNNADREAILENNRATVRAGQALSRIVDVLSVLVADPLARAAASLEASVVAQAEDRSFFEATLDALTTTLRNFATGRGVDPFIGRTPSTGFQPQGPTLAQGFQDQGPSAPTVADQRRPIALDEVVIEAARVEQPSQAPVEGRGLTVARDLANLQPQIEETGRELGTFELAMLHLGVRFDDVGTLAFRGRQGVDVLRNSLEVLGVDAPRAVQAFESGLFGFIDLLHGFRTQDPLSALSGGLGLLATVATLIRGRSEEAARAQRVYADAMEDVLIATGRLTAEHRETVAAQQQAASIFRDILNAGDLSPIQLQTRIRDILTAFTNTVGNTVGDLASASDIQLLRLGASLGDLFEALGGDVIRARELAESPRPDLIDPAEIDRIVQPLRDFSTALSLAFTDPTSTIDSVIDVANQLDDAFGNLISTINALTAAEESQLRERFNLERIQLRSRAQREFAQAGQDPFEQARIFQRLEGELAAITAAENAALESARRIATGDTLGRLAGTPNLPPTSEQTEEVNSYIERLEVLTGQVQQLDLTSADGLAQFNLLAQQFRVLFFEAIQTFDELPPSLNAALQASQSIFALSGQQAGIAFREGLRDQIDGLTPEQLAAEQVIEIVPSPLGDGRWDIIFTPGPDGIQLPPILNVPSDRLMELLNSQELSDFGQIFAGGEGLQVLPETLHANSDRVFTIDTKQALDLWERIYEATQNDVLPDPLVDGSERVFHIGALQRIGSWRDIYGSAFGPVFQDAPDARGDILPPPIVMPSERVARIGSRQVLTTNDLFEFRIVPRIIEASSLVRVVGSVSVQVPNVEASGPGGSNPSANLEADAQDRLYDQTIRQNNLRGA